MNMDYDLFMQEILKTARAEIEAAGYEQLINNTRSCRRGVCSSRYNISNGELSVWLCGWYRSSSSSTMRSL